MRAVVYTLSIFIIIAFLIMAIFPWSGVIVISYLERIMYWQENKQLEDLSTFYFRELKWENVETIQPVTEDGMRWKIQADVSVPSRAEYLLVSNITGYLERDSIFHFSLHRVTVSSLDNPNFSTIQLDPDHIWEAARKGLEKSEYVLLEKGRYRFTSEYILLPFWTAENGYCVIKPDASFSYGMEKYRDKNVNFAQSFEIKHDLSISYRTVLPEPENMNYINYNGELVAGRNIFNNNSINEILNILDSAPECKLP